MEKTLNGQQDGTSGALAGHTKSRNPFGKARVTVTAALLIFLVSLHFYRNADRFIALLGQKSQPVEAADPWELITPSEKLEWHPCYGGEHQCARLTVPMDYGRPLHTSCDVPKVHVALLLFPAKTPSDPPRPPLILNPGGPGGSGTTLALLLGPALQAIFGDDQPVLGFDPRGIGFTTPRADCWATPPACEDCSEDVTAGFFHRLEWDTLTLAIGNTNSSNVAMKLLNARQRAVNDLCRQKDSQLGAQSILGHASTAHVARDMVSILDAWEEWQDSLGTSASPDTRGKLVYWGFSYGTYLGATFASMFPDRVGRVLLDGVVDAEKYELPFWDDSLYDTDKVLQVFFDTCAGAESKCDFYRPGDDANALRDRYHSVMQRMESDPITFVHPETFMPVVVSPSLMKLFTFTTLYSPIKLFPLLGTLLNYIYTDNPAIASLFVQPELDQLCLLPNLPASALPGDAQRAIMCADKTVPVDMTVEEVQSQYSELAKESQFADVWMSVLLQCNGWNISTRHDSSSPWATARENGRQIKTSYPLLFLSNTYDPVTPLVAGVKMALKFKDAGLLEQESSGHCTILSAASRCTAQAVVDYIRHGYLPPPPAVDGDDYLAGAWTKCPADEHPFQSSNTGLSAPVGPDAELELLDAFKVLQDIVDTYPKWHNTHTSYDHGPPHNRIFVLRA